jgi:tetratricopeptide (TPR) repeat protein
MTGHRYRAALSRVLLAQAGGVGAAGGVGGFRQDRPNEGGGGQDRPKEGGSGGQVAPNREGFRQDVPGGAGGAVAYQAPPLLAWTSCGCASVLAMPVFLADPAAVVDVEGMGRAPDPRLEEVIRLARESIKRAEAGEGEENFEGYLILGEALGRKHKWTEGLMAYVRGLRHRCSKYAVGLTFLVDNHPAFKRLDSLEVPDPLQAEAYYAKGLRFYFDRRYEDAERDLLQAVYYSDQDARYQYFLGLARLAQPGKWDLALEDFRQAARLEKQDKPNRLAVSAALERVQGPARRVLNEIRDRVR